MYTRCPRCGAELVDPGRDFSCPRCNSPVRSLGAEFVADEEGMGPLASIGMSGGPLWKAVLMAGQNLARLGAIAMFAFALVLCFAVLLYGVPQVFQNAVGSGYGATIFILVPIPIGLFTLSGGPFLGYFTIIVAAILASIVYLLYSERRQLVSGLVSTVARMRAPDRNNTVLGLVQLPQVFIAVIFFDYIFAIAVWLAGSSPRVPAFGELPLWYQFYTFANASVYEEFAARTLLCGIPLLLAYILAHSARPHYRTALGKGGAAVPVAARPVPYPAPSPQGAAPAVMEVPSLPGMSTAPVTLTEYLRSRSARGLWGYVLGGGFRIGPLEAFFLVGSSLMFGLAHVPGWDIWKLLPTFVAGLGFGYLFLKVGVHAAILLHFSFDYLDLTATLVPAFGTFIVLVLYLWFIVGAFFFGHYVVQALKWMVAMSQKARAPDRAA